MAMTGKHPSMAMMRAGLIYQDLLHAVMKTYQAWEMECTIDDAREFLLKSKHRDILIRDAIRRADGKLSAVYREIGEEYHISESMVRKIVSGER
jgi:hypothetical protein